MRLYDTKKRLVQLDVLRALAVLLVFGRHLPNIPHTFPEFWFDFFYRFKMFGWIGVDLFFVISGFLVSGLIFREYNRYGNIQLGRFFIRRGFKIYPAFYTLILITHLATPLVVNDVRPAKLQVVSELFYLQNYIPGLWGHTWSLAVEEHFYIILGLLLYFGVKVNQTDPFQFLEKVFVICAPLILIFRFLTLVYSESFRARYFVYPTHLRIDALFFGVILSYLHHYHFESFKGLVVKFRWLIVFFSIAFLSPTVFIDLNPSIFMRTWGLTLIYLGFGGIVVLSLYCVDETKVSKSKIAMALAAMGYYSYSIYLWHQPVRVWGIHFLKVLTPGPTPYLLQVLVFITFSIAIGVGMAKIVEMPFLKLRDRLFPSRSGMLSR